MVADAFDTSVAAEVVDAAVAVAAAGVDGGDSSCDQTKQWN